MKPGARCPLVYALALVVLIAAAELAWVSAERHAAAPRPHAAAPGPAAAPGADVPGGDVDRTLPIASEIDHGVSASPALTR